jgi:hypothetical protein
LQGTAVFQDCSEDLIFFNTNVLMLKMECAEVVDVQSRKCL